MQRLIVLGVMGLAMWVVSYMLWSQNEVQKKRYHGGEILRNPVKFAHRPLSSKEHQKLKLLLQSALDLTNPERHSAIIELSKQPHVTLIKPLTEFIRKLQLKHEKPWEKGYLGQREVITLARCADIEVIDLLIEFLDHPLQGVRRAALENLRKLTMLPKRPSELSPVLSEDSAKRKVIVKVLKEWWIVNKGKVEIRWENAWVSH